MNKNVECCVVKEKDLRRILNDYEVFGDTRINRFFSNLEDGVPEGMNRDKTGRYGFILSAGSHDGNKELNYRIDLGELFSLAKWDVKKMTDFTEKFEKGEWVDKLDEEKELKGKNRPNIDMGGFSKN